MSSQAVTRIMTIDDQYISPDIEQYNDVQSNSVTMSVAFGIMLNKVLRLWASQLDRYRRHHAPAFIFNTISYLWVFIATVIGLFLVNFALLKLDPAQYSFATAPTPIAVLVYTMSTLVVGEAGGMAPVGQLAYVLQLAGALSGVLILLGYVSNVVVSLHRDRDDAAAQGLVVELRLEAQQLDRRFLDYYSVGVDEAYARLLALGASAATLVGYIVRAIPDEAEHET